MTPSRILIGATEDGLFILDLSAPTSDEAGEDDGSDGNSGNGGPIVGPVGTSGSGGGGGGCALGGDGPADVMAPGLFCFALAALVWRKIRGGLKQF